MAILKGISPTIQFKPATEFKFYSPGLSLCYKIDTFYGSLLGHFDRLYSPDLFSKVVRDVRRIPQKEAILYN